jgi:Lon-like protease
MLPAHRRGRTSVPPVRCSAFPMAGWSRDAEDTPAVTAVAPRTHASTPSINENTPPRMVTPTDADPEGADAISHGLKADLQTGSSTPTVTPSPPPSARPDGAAGSDGHDTAITTDGAEGDGQTVPATADHRPPRRRNPRRVALWVVGFLLTAFVLGATFVPLPYYLFKPGSVRDTEPLISVEGTQVYPSDGSISYTTVSLRQASLLGLLQGWLDDDIDIYSRSRVLQGRGVQENREVNLQMMDNSKQVATQVALEQLGYDVDVTVGQVVQQVDPGSPADGVLEANDTIVAVNGERFDDGQDMSRLLGEHRPGDTVTVTVLPLAGEEKDVVITLAPAPDDPNRGIMGVTVIQVVLSYDFPIDVEIDTGDVGGPSAGLAFTLALIDDLTPGDLTGGHNVAATGTISGDSTVGPVGGTGQKAAAVREKDVELFLVPTDDYQDAVEHAGDDLQVVAVDDLDDALAALADLGGNAEDLPQVGAASAHPAN